MAWFYVLGLITSSRQDLETIVHDLKDEVLRAHRSSSVDKATLKFLANDLVTLSSIFSLQRMVRISTVSMIETVSSPEARLYRYSAPDSVESTTKEIEQIYRTSAGLVDSLSRPIDLDWMAEVLEACGKDGLSALDALKENWVEWRIIEQVITAYSRQSDEGGRGR